MDEGCKVSVFYNVCTLAPQGHTAEIDSFIFCTINYLFIDLFYGCIDFTVNDDAQTFNLFTK